MATIIGLSISAQEEPLYQSTLKTSWGENIMAQNVWQEYPRPSLSRTEWQNLNGYWDYAILPKGSQKPSSFDGKILVPFPVESQLSGVQKMVGEKNELWYNRNFNIPSKWSGKRIMLNFGAVDWKADVWVNGVNVGSHEGGYTPFSFDITDALKKGENNLSVRVFDPTDNGTQPRGTQVNKPNFIWYTPVTGIWQTVWLEPVANSHIENLKITPDVENNRLLISASTGGNGVVKVSVLDGNKVVATGSGLSNSEMEVQMPADVKLWTPDSPYIYNLAITFNQNGKEVDKVSSYTAMRSIGTARDKEGVLRFTLNGKQIFHFGPLDQGWWPDGLYTPPSYEAMIYDIDKTKEMGFNMIRKHIKVEPELWYEYCDRHGILVWQDMPSGDITKEWQNYNYFKGEELQRSEESANRFRKEWQEIMTHLYNHPAIAVWVPFNEAWGQFDTKKVAEWTKKFDPTRLVNPASGGNFFYDCGDILDVHHYPHPRITLLNGDKANVLGEYGGIGYPIREHLWKPDQNWGYIEFKSPSDVTDKYVEYVKALESLAKIAYTGAVYTQTTDVEIEVNGLLTYDRKMVKVEIPRIREANKSIIDKFSE